MLKMMLLLILSCFMVLTGCVTKGSIAGGATGTATASAQGFYGPVTVTIIVENGWLTSVEAEGPNETPGIGSRALTNIPAQMKLKNTLDADIISGATITSQAIIAAAKEAAAQIE